MFEWTTFKQECLIDGCKNDQELTPSLYENKISACSILLKCHSGVLNGLGRIFSEIDFKTIHLHDIMRMKRFDL